MYVIIRHIAEWWSIIYVIARCIAEQSGVDASEKTNVTSNTPTLIVFRYYCMLADCIY